MTKENRAERRTCPNCDTKPILRSDGDVFCDLCNEHMDRRVLVS